MSVTETKSTPVCSGESLTNRPLGDFFAWSGCEEIAPPGAAAISLRWLATSLRAEDLLSSAGRHPVVQANATTNTNCHVTDERKRGLPPADESLTPESIESLPHPIRGATGTARCIDCAQERNANLGVHITAGLCEKLDPIRIRSNATLSGSIPSPVQTAARTPSPPPQVEDFGFTEWTQPRVRHRHLHIAAGQRPVEEFRGLGNYFAKRRFFTGKWPNAGIWWLQGSTFLANWWESPLSVRINLSPSIQEFGHLIIIF